MELTEEEKEVLRILLRDCVVRRRRTKSELNLLKQVIDATEPNEARKIAMMALTKEKGAIPVRTLCGELWLKM